MFSELEGPALSGIVDEIAKVPYLEEIVVGLDNATQDEFKHSLEYFSRLPHHHRILWNDGPRLSASTKNSEVLVLHLPKRVKVEMFGTVMAIY